MTKHLILPIAFHRMVNSMPLANDLQQQAIKYWFNEKISFIESVLKKSSTQHNITTVRPLPQTILNFLIHKRFNYQSKKNIQHILPSVEAKLQHFIQSNSPIQCLYLYNGAYRASCFPNDSSLVYEPDQTEFMLLYQIALLQEKVKAVYAPGIEFTIVLNNGVAHWVNDIPLEKTTFYAKAFRNIIHYLGADSYINILLQSELPGFDTKLEHPSNNNGSTLSNKDHQIIERFMGRTLNSEEATQRAHTYIQAEQYWFKQLSEYVGTHSAIWLRQIADNDMLSFRPFPGGAIRSQNGSFGFEVHGDSLLPKLITSENSGHISLSVAPMSWPWQHALLEQAQAI